eukprot:6177779-Pleurochrysis_carterae.AAC.2
MEPRAWVGVNLGLSSQSPGAYQVFVPGLRVVVTSDVYFDESCFPWSSNPLSPISAAGVPPQHAGTNQQHGLTDAPDPPSPHDVRTADHVLGAAAQSRRTLLLFSGPIRRPDGISAFLNGYGLECDSIDNHRAYGGGDSHNILHDSVYTRLLQRCAAGHYAAVVASPPCSTFSISRHYRSAASPDGGPPVIRTREHPLGVPNVPDAHRKEL